MFIKNRQIIDKVSACVKVAVQYFEEKAYCQEIDEKINITLIYR